MYQRIKLPQKCFWVLLFLIYGYPQIRPYKRNQFISNMTFAQFKGGPLSATTARRHGRREEGKKLGNCLVSKNGLKAHQSCHFVLTSIRKQSSNNAIKCCASIADQYTSDEIHLNPSNAAKRLATSNIGSAPSVGIFDSIVMPEIRQASPHSVQAELIMLSLPAIAGQAIEPLAQLMETAYIGRLGPLELASAGVSISIFNIISKVFNIPLLSVATSFVAEDISRAGMTESSSGLHESTERKLLPSVSTALLLALTIGVFEASAMYFGSGLFLKMMGISSTSSMRNLAQQFLMLRAIGAPAVVVSLAIQGIFRGFKDTRTPVLCLGFGNLSAVFLFPILMFFFQLGVTGAAISTVISQYIVTFLMIWHLNKKTVLLLPRMKNLHFGGYLSSGGFLLGRTVAAVLTITLSTSMATRQGPVAMAAHQICLQVWLCVSLLVDAQASSVQALIATSFAKGDFTTLKETTYFALKTGLFTGLSLALILAVSFGSITTLFTTDTEVLRIARSGLLFVSASQLPCAMAYIFDGLHYGISDFSYAALSMMAVGAVSSAFMLYASSILGLSGVWTGLALFMGLRTVAGYARLLSKNGPWRFLQEDMYKVKSP